MSLNCVKKAMLAGTALVAIVVLSTNAYADPTAVLDGTLTPDDTWAETGGTPNVPNGTADNALAEDNVNTNGSELLVTNDQTANDGSGLNAFNIGAITDTTATGSVVVTNGSANDMTVTIASVSQTDTGSLAVSNSNFATNSNTVTVTGALTEGTVTLTNSSTTGATVALTVGGNVTLTGGTGVTILSGSSGANSILTLNGTTDALVAVTLNNSSVGTSTGLAELVIGGTGAATVSGTIDNGGGGQSLLQVTNTAGATFTGAIGGGGSLTEVEAGVSGTTTTFDAAVNATTLAVTGTGTVALDGTLTGAVDFAGSNGVVTVASGMNIAGAVDNSTGSGGTLDLLGGTQNVSGAVGATGALTLVEAGQTGGATTFGSTVNATTIDVGTGSVSFGGAVTGAVNFGGHGGTVTMASGTGITGTVDNSTGTGGTLDLAGGTQSVSGAVGTTGALALVEAGQAGGATTFGSTVKATTVDIGTGSSTFDGTVTGAINFGGNSGTVTMASGANIVGAVDNSTGISSGGTLTLSGGIQNVSGIVGGTHPLTLVSAGATGGTSSFTLAVNAATLDIGAGAVTLTSGFAGTTANFTGNGTLNLASGQTIAAAITTANPGSGNVVFEGNGTITGTVSETLGVAGNVLNSLTVDGTGTTGIVNGDLVAANTTTVGGNMLATGGKFNMGATQTLNAEITGAATNGSVAATGIATIASGATLDVSIAPSYHPVVGSIGTYEFVTGASGGSVSSSVTLTGAPLYTLAQINNDNDLEVTATRDTISSVATTPNNIAVAAALDTIGSTGNAAVQAIQSDLNAATTKAALNNVLSSLTPTVDGGVQASVLEVGAEIEDIADTRMAALRADDGTTGVAAGVGANGASMWAQGYGQEAIQDERDFIAGYDATTVGGAVGMDTANLIPEGIIGLMLNYGQTDINSKNVNATTTDVDGYGLNLYGTGFLVQQMFLEWQAGYSYNKVDSDRHNVGAAGMDALGNTDSTEYDTRLELGQDYDVDYGTVLTPDISATYTHLNTNGYQETGSGANLDVGSNSQNELDLGIGAKMAWNLRSYYGPLLKPVVRVGYSYAAVDDRIDTTSTFAGAAPGVDPAFVTMGPTPERSRLDFGAGVTYMTYANWDMSANANYEYRSDYQAYSGIMRMTAHF